MNFAAPVPEQQAIETRLGMLKGDETIRGTPAEAMSRLLRESHGKDAAVAAAKQAGFQDAAFNMLQKYPLKEFLLFEQSAAAKMAVMSGSFDEAVFKIGAAAVHLFFDSVAGKTMKLLAGKEPHRLLSAVPNGYSVLVNFGERSYLKTGERSGTFTFRHELLGAVHTAGIFDAALRSVYHVDPKIALESSSIVDFRFKISW
jgi:uncharacterized protein (TIGR02265 family)